METNNEKVEIEIIEIEIFARENKPVPKGKKYKIRVDKENFDIPTETITGQGILDLVKKSSDSYNLYQHFHGAQTKIIKPDDIVDLTAPGVERFSTMKIENTEG
ncbi:MAG: multiubiquitin domain-containing protein [Candidatus Doudnabacteria bacterium]